jgi:hypothetical protein
MQSTIPKLRSLTESYFLRNQPHNSYRNGDEKRKADKHINISEQASLTISTQEAQTMGRL